MIPIAPYSKKCKDTKGGIKKLFLFPFVLYSKFQIVIQGMELISFPPTAIYEFDCEGSYSQTSDFENGAMFFNQTASVSLSKVYNVLDIQSLLLQDMRMIVQTNNNQYLILGTFNGITGTTNNGSGETKNAFNGFKIDYTGKEEQPILWIKDLADAGFGVQANGLNYTLNFTLS